MFDITTSRDFLAKLEADFEDFCREPGSGRLALNCALTAHHMDEWVWGDWLKMDHATWKILGIRNLATFQEWLRKACVWLVWMKELANGTKHFNQQLPFQALRVSAAPFSFGMRDAGWGEGAWDGPLPFTTGEKVVLLIDNGPEAAERRWITIGQLLDVVVRFWQDFFERYAPKVRPADVAGL